MSFSAFDVMIRKVYCCSALNVEDVHIKAGLCFRILSFDEFLRNLEKNETDYKYQLSLLDDPILVLKVGF